MDAIKYKVVVTKDDGNVISFDVDTILFSFAYVFEQQARFHRIDTERVERIELLKNETRALLATNDGDLAENHAIWSVYSLAQDEFCECAMFQVSMLLSEVANLLAILDAYGTFLYENADWSRNV